MGLFYFQEVKNMKSYILKIRPALEPGERHKIEDKLKELGYHISGGGTHMDMSECDISFDKESD